MSEELVAWIWFSLLKGVSTQRKIDFLNFIDFNVRDLFLGTHEKIRELNALKKELSDLKLKDEANRIGDVCEKNSVDVIPFGGEEYPYLLRNINNPPIVLYKRGKSIAGRKCFSIVGTRKPSGYGEDITRAFSKQLAMKGYTIVSGMALGVDTFAHVGALDGGGETIAVFGCGIDTVYPKENLNLAKKIIENGAIVSEYAPGVRPNSFTFPQRNRIISGLSVGTLITQASVKSGSLITGSYALEQGRELFSVPGDIRNFNMKGCNLLIKEGANVATCVNDIFEVIDSQIYDGEDQKSNHIQLELEEKEDLSGMEREILNILKEDVFHIDDLAQRLASKPNEIYIWLLMLELKNLVVQLPGRRFKLKF